MLNKFPRLRTGEAKFAARGLENRISGPYIMTARNP